MGELMKRNKKTHLNVWIVLCKMVWVHPKKAKTVSSTIGAFMGVGSLRPWIGACIDNSAAIVFLFFLLL
jgi:hypothetical protein